MQAYKKDHSTVLSWGRADKQIFHHAAFNRAMMADRPQLWVCPWVYSSSNMQRCIKSLTRINMDITALQLPHMTA